METDKSSKVVGKQFLTYINKPPPGSARWRQTTQQCASTSLTPLQPLFKIEAVLSGITYSSGSMKHQRLRRALEPSHVHWKSQVLDFFRRPSSRWNRRHFLWEVRRTPTAAHWTCHFPAFLRTSLLDRAFLAHLKTFSQHVRKKKHKKLQKQKLRKTASRGAPTCRLKFF